LSFHRKKQRIEKKKEGLGFLFDVQGEINKKSVIYEIGQEMGNISWQIFFCKWRGYGCGVEAWLSCCCGKGYGRRRMRRLDI